MKNKTNKTALHSIAALFLFPLLGLGGLCGGLSAQSVSNMAVLSYPAKQVTFTVSWTASPHNNQIWVIVDYIKVVGASTTGSWSRASIDNVAATGDGNATKDAGGFWLNTLKSNGNISVTATLSLASGVDKFNWCAYALDTPPQAAILPTGGYALVGTPPFTVNGSKLDDNVTTIGAGTCIATLTDATGNPKCILPGLSITDGNSPTICYNATAQLSTVALGDGVTKNMTYIWNIGGSASTTSDPQITTGNLNNTTTYTVTAQNANGCTSAVSNTGTITVRPNFTAGAIGTTGQTICYGATPGAIGNITVASGGDDVITYEWRHNGEVIYGTNASSYEIDPSYSNTPEVHTFTRWAHDATCNTGWYQSSGALTLTVLENFTAGAIATNEEIVCYGAAPSEIGNTAASGGNKIITYEWRHNGDVIDGATTSAYTPTEYNTKTGVHTFTRWAKDGRCKANLSQSSGTWVLKVRPNFTAGAIGTTGQTICYGATPGAIGNITVASGGDDVITYEWRRNGEVIYGTNASSYTPADTYSNTHGAHTFTRWAHDATCNTGWYQSSGQWVLDVASEVIITALTDAERCDAGTVTLSATASGGTPPYANYYWIVGNSAVTRTTTNTYTPAVSLGTTSFTVYVEDKNGCSSDDYNGGITAYTSPSVSILDYTPNVCGVNSVTLTASASNANSYAWYKDGTSKSGSGNKYTATESGNYTVRAVGAGGCAKTSAAKKVTIVEYNDCCCTGFTSVSPIDAFDFTVDIDSYEDPCPAVYPGSRGMNGTEFMCWVNAIKAGLPVDADVYKNVKYWDGEVLMEICNADDYAYDCYWKNLIKTDGNTFTQYYLELPQSTWEKVYVKCVY